MPIHCPVRSRSVSRDEFHRLDYRVTGIVFATHNDLVRLHEERVYQGAIMPRCQQTRPQVGQEAPIEVSHGDFTKTYSMDLLVDDCVLHKMKAAEALAPRHRQQTLDYLFRAGLRHGKLGNMRPHSVESEFVDAMVTRDQRPAFEIIPTAGPISIGTASGRANL